MWKEKEDMEGGSMKRKGKEKEKREVCRCDRIKEERKEKEEDLVVKEYGRKRRGRI